MADLIVSNATPDCTKNEQRWVVYAIVDPRTHEIFYVGQTSDFEGRKRAHSSGSHSVCGEHIASIRNNGFLPLFILLERRADLSSALASEAFWIELLRSRGVALLNRAGEVQRKRDMRTQRLKLELHPRTAPASEKKAIKTENLASLNVKLGRRPNSHMPWTLEGEEELKRRFESGESVPNIAESFNRSEGAIVSRLVRMGLIERR